MCKLEEILSQKRLDKYKLEDSFSTEDAFKVHLFNTELAESFFPILSYFEIVLRNKIDFVFSKHMGKDWILDTRYHIGHNVEHFNRAIDRVEKAGKDTRNKNHIIAELNLGFWTGLFTKVYETPIWNAHSNILDEIFEHGKKQYFLSKYRTLLNRIRLYRNKVFHYDAIIMMPQKENQPTKIYNLVKQIITRTGGKRISRDIQKIDRFESVYSKGVELRYVKK